MRTMVLVFVIVLLFSLSCFKMDDFLYNPNVHPIDHYALQNYKGEVKFRLPDSLALANTMIHLFTVNSNNNGDVKKYMPCI